MIVAQHFSAGTLRPHTLRCSLFLYVPAGTAERQLRGQIPSPGATPSSRLTDLPVGQDLLREVGVQARDLLAEVAHKVQKIHHVNGVVVVEIAGRVIPRIARAAPKTVDEEQ
jgi:hypothetical protein